MEKKLTNHRVIVINRRERYTFRVNIGTGAEWTNWMLGQSVGCPIASATNGWAFIDIVGKCVAPVCLSLAPSLAIPLVSRIRSHPYKPSIGAFFRAPADPSAVLISCYDFFHLTLIDVFLINIFSFVHYHLVIILIAFTACYCRVHCKWQWLILLLFSLSSSPFSCKSWMKRCSWMGIG